MDNIEICALRKNRTPVFIFNEQEYGRYLYEDCNNDMLLEPRRYSRQELIIYAKYIRIVLKKSEREVRNELIKFCNLNYQEFNAEIQYDLINEVIEASYIIDFRECNGIPISNNEWNKIMSLESEKEQRVLFAMLVFAKFKRFNPIRLMDQEEKDYSEYQYLRCDLREEQLFKIAKVSFKEKNEKLKMYYNFRQNDLAKHIRANTPKRVILFGEIEVAEEDTKIIITEFDTMMKVFSRLKEPDKYIKCKKCGKLYRKNSVEGGAYWCKKCMKTTPVELQKEIKEHLRKNPPQKRQEERLKFKTITCIDCNTPYSYSKHISSTKVCRCPSCQKKYRQSLTNKGLKEIVCTECGEIALVSANRKVDLCDECYEKQNSKLEVKVVVCEDCGKEFEVKAKDNKTKKCPECYKVYRKEKVKEAKQKWKEKQNKE